LVDKDELKKLVQTLSKINQNILIIKTVHKPTFLITSLGSKMTADYLKGKRIFAFCGIGNPSSFIKTLENAGAVIEGFDIFNDHYNYAADDIRLIDKKSKKVQAEFIITTQKDWSKIKELEPLSLLNITLAYLEIEIRITEGEEEFRRLILDTVSDKI